MAKMCSKIYNGFLKHGFCVFVDTKTCRDCKAMLKTCRDCRAMLKTCRDCRAKRAGPCFVSGGTFSWKT